MRQIDALLFEFDGIIADTAASRRMAFNIAFDEWQLNIKEPRYQETCAGSVTRDALQVLTTQFRRPVDAVDIDLMAARVDAAFTSEISKGVVLVAGARSAILQLSNAARLGIVSHLPREPIQYILAMAGLSDAFAFVIGEEDAFPSKPDPAPYLAALARLGSHAERAIAVESSSAGIRSAHRAGLPCIACGEIPAHYALDADAFAPSIAGWTLNGIAGLLPPSESSA